MQFSFRKSMEAYPTSDKEASVLFTGWKFLDCTQSVTEQAEIENLNVSELTFDCYSHFCLADSSLGMRTILANSLG